VEPRGDAHRLVLPGGRAVEAVHVGPYETMTQTYETLQAWMSENDLVPGVGMWECYLSDPEAEPDPANWRTKIVWPLAGGT
jgi:effector-binding domain-containing protein